MILSAGVVLKPAGRESCGVAFTGGILLNSENLNTILAQYIHDFAELSLSQTSGEGSLWQAIDTFGAEWDIEASDFPAMFARAMQGAADQLDTPAVQPVAGLKLLMMRDSEVELVRECFRWLYNDEDDDLKKRRGRAEMFADQITGRFRRCFPRMNKYTMTPANAVYFLNLWMPEENFFYIPAEAKAWADFMEYPAEFGNGASLDLAAYYAMCEDLVTALADCPREDARFVLEQLYEADQAGRSLGREAILAAAREAGLPCSQQEVRRILAGLDRAGLVRVSRGRGGTRLTPAGRALCRRQTVEGGAEMV